jgi:glycosyltransferase involved in cell wall biosynthesis
MITLAIPFYKRLDYLKLAIESVLKQTSKRWRLIVSDDGGNEPGAQAVVAAFDDNRITYSLSESHLGMVGNWNRCLELADTPYVTLLHADDELLPNYVELMETNWKKHPEAFAIFCQPKLIGERGQSVFSFPDLYKRFLIPSVRQEVVLNGEPAVHSLIRGNYIFCPTLCYRKAALGALKFDDKWKQVQDLDFVTTALFDGQTLIGLPERAYAYRRHGGNATESYTRSLLRFEEEVQLFKKLALTSRQKHWKKAEKAAKAATVLRLHLLYRIIEDLGRFRWKDAGRKAKFLHRHLTGI